MEIRAARDDAKDATQLLELGRLAWMESPRYQHLSYEPERALEFTEALLRNEWAIVLVVVDGEQIVGVLAGIVAPYFFAQQLYASDVFFYVRSDYRGGGAAVALLAEWEHLLKTDGRVTESVLGISSEIDSERTRKFYEKLGYRMAGYMMVKSHQ